MRPSVVPVADALRLIAAWGLGDGAVVGPFTTLEWATLLERIRFERITGLAVEAALGGGLLLSSDQDDELLRLHRAAMSWCLFAEQKLLRLAEALEGAGIEYAVLKGPSLAHTVYAEPCLRPFGDLDLLVRSRDYDRATALMACLGHVRRRPEPRPGWEARFGKASVHVHPNDGVEIDLHRTLALGPFGQWIDGDELMDHRSAFQLAGRKLPRLDDTGMLVNVAVHAALGWAEPRVVPVRDIISVERAGQVDVDRLARWARHWHLASTLLRASDLSQSFLEVCPTTIRAAAGTPQPIDERLLASYSQAGRTAAAVDSIRAIRGVENKTAYAWALVFPSREFLDSRGTRGGGSYVRRWLEAARRVRIRRRAPINATHRGLTPPARRVRS